MRELAYDASTGKLLRFVAERLEHDMDALLAALHFDHDGRPVLDSEELSAVLHQPYSVHYYKITRSATF